MTQRTPILALMPAAVSFILGAWNMAGHAPAWGSETWPTWCTLLAVLSLLKLICHSRAASGEGRTSKLFCTQ